MMIQGTWFLRLSSGHGVEQNEGRAHRGWYFACHMNGAAALPTQYAMSMIAFVVMRFVCPAVTLESHESESTNPVVPTPAVRARQQRMTI